MQRVIFSCQISISLQSVTETRKQLEKSLIASNIEKNLLSNILLSYSEAATNIIRHNKATQPIISCFSQYKQRYHLSITDDGFPWNPTTFATPNSEEISIFEESGRGVALLRSMSDSIQYQQLNTDYTNELVLIWNKPSTKHTPTVLIVDDDESSSRLYSAYLADGFDVHITSSGHDAIEWLKQHHADLIISDIRMPEIDGLLLRKYVNQNVKTELIPFIFLSSVKEKDIIETACNLGVDDILQKPVAKLQLIQTINRVLNRNQQIEYLASSKIQRKISRLLKPEIPTSYDCWNIALRHRNTGLGGGDILLSHQTDDAIHITIIDIMGHDEIAKFFSYAYGGYIKGLMKSYSPPLSPSQLLEKLSQLAYDDDLLSHVTLTCCSLLLTTSGKMSVATAGHPAPIILSKGSATAMNIGGVLPGLIPNARYPELEMNISPSQRIAIFTDGLFESSNTPQGRIDLENQIIDSLIHTQNDNIEKSISTVMSVFDGLAGTPPNDDTLLLLIGR